MIFSKEILPDERLSKDGIELVAIDEKQLKRKENEEKKLKKQDLEYRRQIMKDDVKFI